MVTFKCHFCPATDARIEGNHWTGTEYIRVPACDACYEAGSLQRKPRAPRKPRVQPVYAATDWNYLVAFTQGRKRSN